MALLLFSSTQSSFSFAESTFFCAESVEGARTDARGARPPMEMLAHPAARVQRSSFHAVVFASRCAPHGGGRTRRRCSPALVGGARTW
uniref:Uncharacterized protein n=1 Tax=Setaria italica TaxID=4555 RepID=K3YNI2_SETIT